jgi:tRNA (cytidine/uridine-2'-O-)-methyltransferase
MPNVFLYAPQDFRNLCVLARTLEVFGHVGCYVFDPRRLVRERYGKSRSREMRVVSAGAFSKIRWTRIEEPEQFLKDYAGRVIATVAHAQATELTRFQFLPEDLLLFGSESHGLPAAVVDGAHAKLTIPSRGQTQSLNLAVSLAIVLFEAHRQLEGPA